MWSRARVVLHTLILGLYLLTCASIFHHKRKRKTLPLSSYLLHMLDESFKSANLGNNYGFIILE